MKLAEFATLSWEDEGRWLIAPTALSPLLADPTFLFPSETPEGNWCLIAHTAFGLRRFSSPDGVCWTDCGTIVRHGMRAFLRREEDIYRLYYEHYPPFALSLSLIPCARWRSRIALSESPDLCRWSRLKPVFSPELPWHGSARGPAVGNPSVFREADGRYVLYYSAGLTYIPDCGFYEPAAIGRAWSDAPYGPFVPDKAPIFTVDPYERNLALSPGSIKVIRLEDGYVGFQNRIDWDEQGRSRSAIFVLGSEDGQTWWPLHRDPLLAPDDAPGPDGKPWRTSHVYACDVRQNPEDGRWYLYYNARDGWWKTRGTERIGRIVSN